MTRSSWIPALLAQSRNGWTAGGNGKHEIVFPPEAVRACWLPRPRRKHQRRPSGRPLHLKKNDGIRTPPDPAVVTPKPRRSRATSAEVEARRVLLLETAATMARPGKPLSARAVARACGISDMDGLNDRLALIKQGRWPYATAPTGPPRFGTQAWRDWRATRREEQAAT